MMTALELDHEMKSMALYTTACISNCRFIFYIQQWFCKKYCVSKNKSTDVSSISDKIPQRNVFMRLTFLLALLVIF